MAAATRSPSPNPSRPSSPNLKTLERSCELRKSGTFNLSKHGNCSEIPVRNSGSKSASILPSPRASFEQKENERDSNLSKPARARSPARNPSKGMKSFMAPTISASSKITAASPRKKILAERNEVVQDSIGVKVEEIRPKSEMGIDSEEISDRNRSRMLDFSDSREHHQSAPTHSPSSGLYVAPLDADPSLHPYDPLTNYLSPRPQFLHYKPSPRIEQNPCFVEDSLYMGEGRRLEDNFSASEDSDDCSEYGEGEQSSPLKKEPEDEFPSNVMTRKPQDYVETHVFEPKPFPETYKPRSRSFSRSKLIPFLLVLSIVAFCVPMTDSPLIYQDFMKGQSFVSPHIKSFGVLQDMRLKDYLAFTNDNLKGLATRMRQWSIDSIAILSSSGSISKEGKGISHSINLTLSPPMVEKVNLNFGYSSELELASKKDIIEGQSYFGDNMEKEFELEETVVEALIDMDDAEKIKIESAYSNGDGAGDEIVFLGKEDNYPKYEEGINSFTDPSIAAFGTIKEKDISDSIEIATSKEVNGEVYPVHFEIEQKLEEQVLIELGQEHNQPLDNENIKPIVPAVESQMMNRKEDVHVTNFLSKVQHFIYADINLMLLGILLAALAIAATTLVFLFVKQNQTRVASYDKLPSKKTGSVSDGTVSCRNANGSHYHNLLGFTEVVGDSGPTEMSYSFNNSMSFSQQRTKIGSLEVTSSHETMQRRDSVSSSVSYGSFTTYEKLSARKGMKDEEMVTPVRRSSRIRSQITSP